MDDFIHSILLVFAGLFPIVNPVGDAPIFLTLTRHCSKGERHSLAGKVAINSFILLTASLFLGSGDDARPLVVNAYHHQGVRDDDLAPGLVASAWADSSAGPLVEGLEAPGSRFVVGVQCHPERTESTPTAFENVFEAFVAAAR